MKKIYLLFLIASSGIFAQGSLCTDPIVIGELPYTTTDNTANYLDSYDPQTTTSPFCALTVYGNQYHSGNDVIYSYTATQTTTIKVEIPGALGWTGMFIYNDCESIGINYLACATGPSAGNRTISNFPVTAGQTIFIYVSSWEAPQTVAYTLNVTVDALGTSDFEKSQQVVLFPNPTNNQLFLETTLSITSAVVYNVNGQKLDVKLSGNEAIIGHLQSGLYIMELTTADGITIRKKFIKS